MQNSVKTCPRVGSFDAGYGVYNEARMITAKRAREVAVSLPSVTPTCKLMKWAWLTA